MISNLMKLTFIGCIVIAASVPAEAGLFDRILNRHGGRSAGCCQPKVVCAPAPCAPAPCVCAPCVCAPCVTAPACPCTTAPTCSQQYAKDLKTCERLFGNNSQACRECQMIAKLAYCECINDPHGKRMARAAELSTETMQKVICVLPEEPSPEICHAVYMQCVEAGGTNCARCFFQCSELCLPPVETP
jgi:hypothetical protein